MTSRVCVCVCRLAPCLWDMGILKHKSRKENLARYKLNSKGKKLKTIVIDNTQFRYNPTKPISNKLKSKEKKRKTNEYRAYQIKEQSATGTVKKNAIRKRATIPKNRVHLKRMPMLTPSQIFI